MAFRAGILGIGLLLGCPGADRENSGVGGDMGGATDAANGGDATEGNLLYIAKLESTTTGDEGCATADPGPDIFGIGLEDGLGEPLGWGRPVWEQLQIEANDYGNTAIFDGSAVDLAPGACPDTFDDESVVSLGCEETGADAPRKRWIAFEFLDADGNRVGLDASADQVIRVYEWGGQCTNGTLSDTYDLTICTDTAGIEGGDDASCTITLLVDADGEQLGEVRGF